MRLKVRVCYGDESVEMEVACGNGLNSVKWLATVATQRLTTQNAPHGRIRRSEDKSFLVASHRRLQASDVTTDEQTKFYHPDAQLVDCFDDGQRVNVIVEKDAKLDEATGGRILSRWAIVAYCQSQPERVAAALKEENFEREEALRQRKLEDEERKTDDDRVKAQLMRNLISSQLIESDRLEVKMKEEWEHMNRRGLVESWIRAEKERDKVFQLLKENFVSLLELFRFYGASTTSAVDAHLMEFVEFCAFCRDIDIFGGPNDLINHTTLAGAFAECAGIDVADVKYAHFEFGDFLASLIWLALTTKGGLGGTKSSAPTGFTSKEAVDSARRSIMRIKDLSQIGSAFPTSQALKQLLDENISSALKLHQSQLIGPVTKEKLATDEILAIFYVHVDRLQAVFKTYVSKLPKEEDFQLTEGYMTMNEYIVLLEHSKLIGGGGDSTGENEKDSTAKNTRNKDHEHDVLTMKEVRQAFAGAQDDDLDVTAPPAKSKHSVKTSTATGIISRNTAESNGSGGAAGNQSMLLSFAEFLEVVLRLALLKWDDDTYTTGQKLTMAIEAVLANSVSKMTTTTARGGRRRSSLFRSGGKQVTPI